MNAADARPAPRTTNNDSFFLTAYRDHLLAELAEVERRLKMNPASRSSVGFES